MNHDVFPKEEYSHIYKKIIQDNLKRERQWLRKEACKSSEVQRRNAEIIPDKKNIRSAFAHDTDRIIHCKAYARFIDKTQVFFLIENDHITHRVLHVQFVAKISRTIAKCLRLNQELVEAISLAHDLGHAPFGHAGEEFISEALRNKGAGNFVHNAQSVRVLEEIENEGKGINISLQVLDGVLGHNGELLQQTLKPVDNPKWSDLDANLSRCFVTPKSEKKIYPHTLEGCVVRIADVISYIGRDIEDAITVGLIKREDLPKEATEIIGSNNREIINNLTMDLIHNSFDKDFISFSEPVFKALKLLMEFNYESIYFHPNILEEKKRLREVFLRLFDSFLEDLNKNNKDSSIIDHLSHYIPEYREKNPPARLVADFLAGMTDDFIVNQYQMRFVPRSLGYKFLNARIGTING
jgi:dGTPase